MPNELGRVVRGEVLPPETHEIRMPAGTPLGLGILGAARFSAIRRVLEHAASAAHAKANLHHAETAVANAIVGREIAREQLRNIDVIRQAEADRITEGAQIVKLRRQLERMELEDQVADKEARRAKIRGTANLQGQSQTSGGPQDEFVAFMNDLQRLPEVAKAVSAAKEQIIKNAGGKDKLSEADQQICDMFDAMLQAFMSKRAGETAL